MPVSQKLECCGKGRTRASGDPEQPRTRGYGERLRRTIEKRWSDSQSTAHSASVWCDRLHDGRSVRKRRPRRSMTGARRIGWQTADPSLHPVLIVNPRSGGGTARRAGLVERAREHGIDALELGPKHGLAALIEEALDHGADALGMAGGDGSMAAVAAAAADAGLPFVCVPAGTRNHFARDLRLDARDPVAALDAFSDGVESRIDLGEVNGRPFVNNVSLGVYGEAVAQPGYRDAKLQTLLETARAVLGPSGRPPTFASSTDRAVSTKTPRWCWCRTTRMPWVARAGAAHARRSTAAVSGLSSSTRRMTADALPHPAARDSRGPRRRCGSALRVRSMRASTARRRN